MNTLPSAECCHQVLGAGNPIELPITEIKLDDKYIKKLLLETLQEFYRECRRLEHYVDKSDGWSQEYNTELVAIEKLLENIEQEK